MSFNVNLNNEELFKKLKLISNRVRFKILELSQHNNPTITELSSKLKISYNKCADYVAMLEKAGLLIKEKEGKEVRVQSKVRLNGKQIIF